MTMEYVNYISWALEQSGNICLIIHMFRLTLEIVGWSYAPGTMRINYYSYHEYSHKAFLIPRISTLTLKVPPLFTIFLLIKPITVHCSHWRHTC
jgi:hypothetical protein